MFTLYTTFTFLHVAAVIVWLGSTGTLALLNLRLLGRPERRDLLARAATGDVAGPFFGLAALLTLVAGFVMVANARIPFSTLWIAWGMGGMVVSLLIGATLIRRTTEQLHAAAATDAPAVTGLQRRLVGYSLANLALLVSVVWAMVAKPML